MSRAATKLQTRDRVVVMIDGYTEPIPYHGSLLHFEEDPAGENSGKWYVKLDRPAPVPSPSGGFSRRETTYVYADPERISPLDFASDPLASKAQSELIRMYDRYGEAFMGQLLASIQALDPQCRIGRHEWKRTGPSSHGVASERMRCTREGCDAMGYD
jgi:hypothetical protein